MAVDDLPGPVVNLLKVIGVPWPYIDEDTVSRFATLARQFGQAVQTTHQDATRALAAAAGTPDAPTARTHTAALRGHAETLRSLFVIREGSGDNFVQFCGRPLG